MTASAGGAEALRPAGIRQTQTYLPELESLRGWAILIVVLYHADGLIFGLDRLGTDVSPLFAFVSAGHSGVTLFFILSALLLSRPFLSPRSLVSGDRIVRFFERRALRIMPLYAVAIGIAVLMTGAGWESIRDGMTSLVFLNSFLGTPTPLMPFSAVWWSLATEAQFYLLLPLFAWMSGTRVGQVLGFVAVVAWLYQFVYFLLTPFEMAMEPRINLSLSFFGRAPAFLIGIGISWVVLQHGERLRAWGRSKVWLEKGGADALLLLTLTLLGLLLSEVTTRGFFPSEIKWTEWHLPESVLWGVVVLLLLVAPLRTKRLFANPALAWLGLISYSLYLVHYPVLYFGLNWLGEQGVDLKSRTAARLAAVAATFLLSALLSAGTYRWIERPFLLKKARIK